MQHESLEFKIIMDDSKNTEVLAREAHLDLARRPTRLPCSSIKAQYRPETWRADHRASRRRAAAGAADRA
jgi:hypothetical protein